MKTLKEQGRNLRLRPEKPATIHFKHGTDLRSQGDRCAVSGDTCIVIGGKQKNYYYEISQDVPPRPSDKGSLEDMVELWKVKNIRRCVEKNNQLDITGFFIALMIC